MFVWRTMWDLITIVLAVNVPLLSIMWFEIAFPDWEKLLLYTQNEVFFVFLFFFSQQLDIKKLFLRMFKRMMMMMIISGMVKYIYVWRTTEGNQTPSFMYLFEKKLKYFQL